VLDAFDRRQTLGVDVSQPAQIAGKRVDLAFNSRAIEILEQIVVGVDAIERREGRVGFVEVPEEIVDEMGKRLGSDHR
jgi:hypothetical protein